MIQELDMFPLLCLPYPWPPVSRTLLFSKEFNGQQISLAVLPDGRIVLDAGKNSFTSQPVEIRSGRREFALIRITQDTNGKLGLALSGDELLEDKQEVPKHVLRIIQGAVPNELSFTDPNASTACQVWIQNRKQKFSNPSIPHPTREPKTIQLQAQDLHNSVLILRDLQQQILTGKRYFLGHLATELRALVHWPRLKGNKGDSLFTSSYNPLLQRMASLEDLPLPVYFVPRQIPGLIDSADSHFLPIDAPRVQRAFATDQIRDVQEALVTTVLRLGQSPDNTITALEAIKELSSTMGAAHYDDDTSIFLDFMESIESERGDELTIFMCQTADTLASLSEWVLSELKTRKVIS